MHIAEKRISSQLGEAKEAYRYIGIGIGMYREYHLKPHGHLLLRWSDGGSTIQTTTIPLVESAFNNCLQEEKTKMSGMTYVILTLTF